MGPLVPEIISNELNYVAALFIGIAFGFVLEQAGFSTSKKLVGLFYGYDFTVLRVFFTAGVTAMIGVIALAHFGLLDLSLIYINPTFLWSAIIGGLIMGLGFVVGGYCPGTSVCAAAIGKIDAMIFVGGSLLGVLVFAEGFPFLEKLYKAENWGGIRIYDLLGMPQSLFSFLLVMIAVGAFWAVTFVEKKVNGVKGEEFKAKKLYFGLTTIAILIGLSSFILPDRKEDLLNKVSNPNFVKSFQTQIITSDELAFRIIDEDNDLQIFDLRSPKEFGIMSLPKSLNITLVNIFEKDIHSKLSLRGKKNIFIANDEFTAMKGAAIAIELGYENVSVLDGGLNNFQKVIIGFSSTEKVPGRKLVDTYRFRAKASKLIPELIAANKLKQSTVVGEKKTKRIVGGC